MLLAETTIALKSLREGTIVNLLLNEIGSSSLPRFSLTFLNLLILRWNLCPPPLRSFHPIHRWTSISHLPSIRPSDNSAPGGRSSWELGAIFGRDSIQGWESLSGNWIILVLLSFDWSCVSRQPQVSRRSTSRHCRARACGHDQECGQILRLHLRFKCQVSS